MSKLRFDKKEIENISNRINNSNDKLLNDLKPKVKEQGFLTKEDLMRVARWKSRRSAWHVNKNQTRFVEEITRFALAAQNERSRIETLTILNGVGWPTASVILHWFHEDEYPILDFRALWSASMEVPKGYGFSFWWSYVEFCRAVVNGNGVDMRTLDRAMWQYSKENQEKS